MGKKGRKAPSKPERPRSGFVVATAAAVACATGPTAPVTSVERYSFAPRAPKAADERVVALWHARAEAARAPVLVAFVASAERAHALASLLKLVPPTPDAGALALTARTGSRAEREHFSRAARCCKAADGTQRCVLVVADDALARLGRLRDAVRGATTAPRLLLFAVHVDRPAASGPATLVRRHAACEQWPGGRAAARVVDVCGALGSAPKPLSDPRAPRATVVGAAVAAARAAARRASGGGADSGDEDDNVDEDGARSAQLGVRLEQLRADGLGGGDSAAATARRAPPLAASQHAACMAALGMLVDDNEAASGADDGADARSAAETRWLDGSTF